MVSPLLSASLRRACLAFSLILLSLGTAWAAAPAKAPAESPDAVVAIGDVHGDFDDFVAILQHIGLIDKQNHWVGGKTTLVQVGDLLDRGPKPREVMDLMMALETEASAGGGRIISLLGNHEMMNLMGDLRYVTPANYASFTDGNSEKQQKSAYDNYMKWRDKHAALIGELPQPMELTEAEWMARHPQGFVEQREAYSPKGMYGKWLRGHPALAEVGGSIFLHGGIQPDLAKTKVDAINNKVRDEIKQFDSTTQYLQDQGIILPFFNLQEITYAAQAEVIAERKSLVPVSEERQARILDFLKYAGWLSVKPDGPLWFRGYDQWTDEEGTAQAGKLLDAYKVSRIVVGHTVQRTGRIRPRFNNKIFLIDTGMLSSYYPGGRASALELCSDGKILAEYMDQHVVLFDPAGAVAAPPTPGAAVTADVATAPGKLPAAPVIPVCSVAAAASQ